MPLRLVGSSSMVSRVNWVVAVVERVSTTGELPDTVTVSSSAPTFIATSIFAVKPTVSRTPSCRATSNPWSVYWMV